MRDMRIKLRQIFTKKEGFHRSKDAIVDMENRLKLVMRQVEDPVSEQAAEGEDSVKGSEKEKQKIELAALHETLNEKSILNLELMQQLKLLREKMP